MVKLPLKACLILHLAGILPYCLTSTLGSLLESCEKSSYISHVKKYSYGFFWPKMGNSQPSHTQTHCTAQRKVAFLSGQDQNPDIYIYS